MFCTPARWHLNARSWSWWVSACVIVWRLVLVLNKACCQDLLGHGFRAERERGCVLIELASDLCVQLTSIAEFELWSSLVLPKQDAT